MVYLSLMKYQIGEKITKIQLTTFSRLKRYTRETYHIYHSVVDFAVKSEKMAKKNT